jgi:hypothetical protein
MTVHPADPARVDLLGRSVSHKLAKQIVVLPPGCSLDYDQGQWRDCLIEVECGVVTIQLPDGSEPAYGVGDVFWLDGLPVRTVRNPGIHTTLLVAVSRRIGDDQE